jgi:carboxymethylenebutenolidase
MKISILLLVLFVFYVSTSFSQSKSCCEDMTGAEKMASFGGEKDFREAHLNPLPFTLTDGKGEMITFNTPDGKTGSAYEVKTEKPGSKFMLMFHEWWGLNDYIKKEAEELQSQLGDVTVLALDLYDGKVATNQDEAGKYMKEVQNDRALNIIKGAVDYAGTDAVFGTIGWCFGGSWSLQAAIELGDKCKACVIYYGMPEQDLNRLAKLKAPVLGIFAKQDGWITPEVVAKFEENLKSLNIPVDIKEYDAVHAFANPSNPKHDVEATKDAKEKSLSFLKEKMK